MMYSGTKVYKVWEVFAGMGRVTHFFQSATHRYKLNVFLPEEGWNFSMVSYQRHFLK